MKCKSCKSGPGIQYIYIFKFSDCKFKDGKFVGMKRKYGKFNREVHKIKRGPGAEEQLNQIMDLD